MKNNLLLTATAFMAIGCASFQQHPLVYEVENTGAALPKIEYVNPDNLPPCATLPDPFEWSDGSGRSTNFADWELRRNQIKSEIEFYEIGVKPDRPEEITATLTDTVLTVVVSHNGKTVTLTSRMRVPKEGYGPFPVSIGMGRFSGTGALRRDLFENCIQIPYDHDQVAKYSMNDRDTTYPFYQMYPELRGNGNYSAWAWGVSRIIDGLEIVADQLNADLSHICVTGCSYAGKMAMYSSALDERIALAIVQESGGGGINSWRVSDDFTARTDTNVERVCNTNYTWFMPALKERAKTLAEVMPDEADEARLALWFRDLASVIDYIHAEGVVHRDVKLNNIIAQMGAPLMFTGDADFSLMTENKEQLCVSLLKQKAAIEVSEEGTKASAVTAAAMMTTVFTTDLGLSIICCTKPQSGKTRNARTAQMPKSMYAHHINVSVTACSICS